MAVNARRLRALAPAVLAALASTACWPVPGQNSDRTAHNPFESAITTATVGDLTPVWDVPGRGSPVLSGSGVILAWDVTVRRLDQATGATVWSTELPDVAPPFSTAGDAFVAGGRVLVGYGAGNLGGTLWDGATLDPVTGAVDDSPPFSGFIESVRGTQVLTAVASFGSGAGGVYSFSIDDLATGENVGGGYFGYSEFGGLSYGFTLGSAAAYQSGDGPIGPDAGGSWTQGPAVRAFPLSPGVTCGPPTIQFACATWTTEVGGQPTAPVIGPGESLVHVGTDAGDLVALDAATGAVVWTTPVGAAVSGPPALAGGVLYAGTDGGTLVAVDAVTGAVLWSASVGSGAGVAVRGQPAVAGSGVGAVVLVGTADQLVALPAAGCGAATCAPLWAGTVTGGVTSSPVVSGGRVLVTTGAGRLVAFAPA